MGNVVDSDKQEQLGGMSGEYLVQTVIDTHHFVTDNAAVAYVLLAEACRPVTAAFSQAVAKHDDVFACNGRLIHKL